MGSEMCIRDRCEVKNAGSVRTFERYSPIPYMFFVPRRTERHTPPAFSINHMLPPSPLFLGNALFPWKLRCCVICGKSESRRVQLDNEQLYLYQSPEQAFALGLLSPWEGARGHHRKTRKAHFAFVVFHGRGSEWYTKYHPHPCNSNT